MPKIETGPLTRPTINVQFTLEEYLTVRLLCGHIAGDTLDSARIYSSNVYYHMREYVEDINAQLERDLVSDIDRSSPFDYNGRIAMFTHKSKDLVDGYADRLAEAIMEVKK